MERGWWSEKIRWFGDEKKGKSETAKSERFGER
jgi:hypothetical protein